MKISSPYQAKRNFNATPTLYVQKYVDGKNSLDGFIDGRPFGTANPLELVRNERFVRFGEIIHVRVLGIIVIIKYNVVVVVVVVFMS